MNSRRDYRRRNENEMKRRMLYQALTEAFKIGRAALENQANNIGPYEAALEKIRTATTQQQNKGDQGIIINNIEYRKKDGTNVTINNVREELSDLSTQIHVAKQQQILQEKQNQEDKKSYQLKAKQDLKSKRIPDLFISETKNNIALWIKEVLAKDREVMKYNPKMKD